MPSRQPDFADLTETTGVPISAEGAAMMYTRYHLAAELAKGRRVLELGSGSGQGLGLLGRSAAMVVAGDYSLTLLRRGRAHYGSRFPLVRLTAERLPFRAGAFDLVLCFEASYYVPDMRQAFRDISRVLAPNGLVFFANANPERPDFIKSPHSTHYHSAGEFRAALEALGMDVDVEGAFPVEPRERGVVGRVAGATMTLARWLLEALHLVPRTLRGRARLKRLIYGKLLEVPPELHDGFSAVAPRVPIGPGPARGVKVLYVTGRKRAPGTPPAVG
jgi:SAM-dependent methyltransferase